MDGDSGLNIKEVEGRRSQGLLHFLTIIRRQWIKYQGGRGQKESRIAPFSDYNN